MTTLTYTLEELQHELHYKTSNSVRHWIAKMEKDEGFPRKLPGCARWSKPAVDHWFENWGKPVMIQVKPKIEIMREQLEKRYG